MFQIFFCDVRLCIHTVTQSYSSLSASPISFSIQKCQHSCQTVKGMVNHFPKCRQLRTTWECMCGRGFGTRNSLMDHLRRIHGAKVVNERHCAAHSSVTPPREQHGSNRLAATKQERVSGSPPVSPPSSGDQSSSAVSLSSNKTQTSSAVSSPAFQMQPSFPVSVASVKTQTPPISSPLSLSRQNKTGRAHPGAATAKIQRENAETSKVRVAAEPRETTLRCSKNTLDYIPAAENAVCNDHDYTIIEGQHLNLQLTRKRMGGSNWSHCAVATNASSRGALATSGNFPFSRSAPVATIVLSKIVLDEATKDLIGLPSADVRRDQSLPAMCSMSGEGEAKLEVLLINDIHFQYDVNRDIRCQYEVEVVAPDDYLHFVEIEKEKGDIFIMDDEHEVDGSLLEMTDIQVDTFCHEHGQVDGLNLIANLTQLQPLKSSCVWQVDGSGSCPPDGDNTALEIRFDQYRRRYAIDHVSANGSSEFQQVIPSNRFSKWKKKVSHTSLAKFSHVVSEGAEASTKSYDVSGTETHISQLDGSGSKRKTRSASQKEIPAKKRKQVEDEEELEATSSVAGPGGVKADVTLKTAVREAVGDVPLCSSSVDESSSSVGPKTPEERMAKHFQSCLDQGILLSTRKTGPKTGLPHLGSTSKAVTAAKETSPRPSVAEGSVNEVGATPKKTKEMMKGKGKRRSSVDKTPPLQKRKKTSEQMTTPQPPEVPPVEGREQRPTKRKKVVVEKASVRGGGKAPETPIASSQEDIEQQLPEELDTDRNDEDPGRNGIASSAQCIEQYPKDLVNDCSKKAIAQPQPSVAQHTTDEAGMGLDEASSVEGGKDAEQGTPEPAQSSAGRKGKAQAKKKKASASSVLEIPTIIPPVSVVSHTLMCVCACICPCVCVYVCMCIACACMCVFVLVHVHVHT